MAYKVESQQFLFSENGENGARILYWSVRLSRPGLTRTKILKEVSVETHYEEDGFVTKYFVQNWREDWERVGTFFNLEGGSLPHLVMGKDCAQFFSKGGFATREIIFEIIFGHYA